MTCEVIDCAPARRLPGARERRANAAARNQRRISMSTVNEIVAGYIAAWNETDGGRRRDIIARTWSEDASYLDSHREGTGHAAIDAMIGAVQERFPGYRFRLSSGIEAHHDRVRFSWSAGGTEQSPLFFGGTDFAMLAQDGRLRSVTGFIDAMPSVG
jgi:SnoaL-like domain